MKLVITDGYCENPGDLSWEPLKQFGELVIYDRTEDDEDKIIDRIGDADIAIINKVPITERIGSLCAMFPPMGPMRWRNLPCHFCWNCATTWAIMPMR